LEVAHGESVDLDLAQTCLSDFKPANGKRADGQCTDGERAKGEGSDRNRRHACRRQGDWLNVKDGADSVAPPPPGAIGRCGRAGESPEEKGKSAQGSPPVCLLFYSIAAGV
jgi:hypothetical protein